MFAKLALQSLLNRKGSVLLTLMAMTVSVFVLLGVESIRYQAKESFANSVSGVDLIVGARTGSLNLLLYSVFRIGSPTNNISWKSFEVIASDPNVDWAIPMSLGDSHRGYRVLGTSKDYFDHFSYGNQRKLRFREGDAFNKVFDVVLGSEVAAKLNYKLGDKLVLAHGVGETSFALHKDNPFTVAGILAPTGTPVDQTLHVSLQGIEAIHVGWQQGTKLSGTLNASDQLENMEMMPTNITAFMVGLRSKMATFRVQRKINEYSGEPLLAILPGVALSELWQIMSVLEKTLQLLSLLVFVSALLGLSAMLLASIRERMHEIQLLRIIGASPIFLIFLIETEALFVSFLSVLLGAGALYIGLFLFQDYLATYYALYLTPGSLIGSSVDELIIIVVGSLLAALVPSFGAYRNAKHITSQ